MTGSPVMAQQGGGDGAYFRHDVLEIQSARMRSGTSLLTGEARVILEFVSEDGELLTVALNRLTAEMVAEELKRFEWPS